MNCPQCQTANAPGAAFCGNCGAQLAVAEPAGAPGAGYGSQGTGTPLGYGATSGPASYDAPTGYNASDGYNAPGGYNNASSGYNNAPSGYSEPSSGYGNPGTQQQPGGYQQGQYQPPAPGGGYTPGSRGSSVPPVSFDLNRATTVDKVVAVATFITMISIWLPWYTASDGLVSASASGTSVHGWLWLEFLLALVLIVYLVARIAWDKLPFNLPVAHAPVLIVATAVQLLLILIAFIAIPSGDGVVSVGWGWGAFVGLLGALVAAGPVLVPAVRSYLASRNAR
jgi:hypothetical protein